MWQSIVLTGYFISVLFIIVFSIGQLCLVILFLRNGGKHNLPLTDFKYPLITIQLPVYNERFVIGRLLNAVAKLDYPKELLEIQVLDDSTDETKDICRKIIRKLAGEGFNIMHFHRTSRHGFKAGALQEGLLRAAANSLPYSMLILFHSRLSKKSTPLFYHSKHRAGANPLGTH